MPTGRQLLEKEPLIDETIARVYLFEINLSQGPRMFERGDVDDRQRRSRDARAVALGGQLSRPEIPSKQTQLGRLCRVDLETERPDEGGPGIGLQAPDKPAMVFARLDRARSGNSDVNGP